MTFSTSVLWKEYTTISYFIRLLCLIKIPPNQVYVVDSLLFIHDLMNVRGLYAKFAEFAYSKRNK